MDEKQHGKLKTTFYIGIPLLFIAVFGVIILNFLGIPMVKTIQDWGNTLPVINQIIPDSVPEKAKGPDDVDSWKQKYLISQLALEGKDQKIAELTKQSSSNQQEIDDIKKNNEELQKQVENKQTQKYQEQMKQVAGIYASMAPSKAAAILGTMLLGDAALTISLLDTEQQSSIIASMKDSKKAAQITMLLKEIPLLSGTDQVSLKEQIQELAQKQENPTETLAETIAGMPSTQSAIIIQSMMGTNTPIALELMKNVSTTSRSQILTEIAKTDAKLAAQITASLN
jgi:flagellar motility protein MotE (MotC chaperone)